MKKIFLTFAALSLAWAGQAQIVKSNLLDAYSLGDDLEKSVYEADSGVPIQADTWCGGFMKHPTEGSVSPKIVAGLNYNGYPEEGPAVQLGNLGGMKGTRCSVYSLTNAKRTYDSGTYYYAFLLNFTKIGNVKAMDLAAFNSNFTGRTSVGQLFVQKADDGSVMPSIGQGKVLTSCNKTLSLGKTHLVVLKLDYSAQTLSLFIDPQLGGDEPKADLSIDHSEVLAGKGTSIKGLSITNCHNFNGVVGGFRFVKTWADLTASPAVGAL